MTRLVEIINREPAESEKQIVLLVAGESDPIIIDAARSVLLTIDGELGLAIGARRPKPDLLPVVDSLEKILEAGDTELPVDDEGTFVGLAELMAEMEAEQAAAQARLAELDAIVAEARAIEGDAGDDIAILHTVTLSREELLAQGYSEDTEPLDVVVSDGLAARYQDAAAAAAPDGGPTPFPKDWEEYRHRTTEFRPQAINQAALEAWSFNDLRQLAASMNIKGRGHAELVREILAATMPKGA